MPKLLENDYYRVDYDEERDLVIVRRSATVLPQPEMGAQVLAMVLSAALPYAGTPMLSDLRLAKATNDPRYEDAIRPQLIRMRELFPLTARVVKTASGRLQILRMARERKDSRLSAVFTDEAEALAFLEANRPPRSRK